MNNFWSKIKSPIIGLAPMAGITDSAFRQICKSFGTDLLYSEMISSHGIYYDDKKSLELCRFSKFERPFIIQIFGREPKIMAEAAKIIEKEFKPDGIDINFGCPAKRVVRSGHGAALMDEAELAVKIVKAVVYSTRLPVSVKCRLGVESKNDILNFAPKMEKAGISAIAVHGRTLKQGYRGEADWQPIYQAAKLVKIPVLGNGDIRSQKDLAQRLAESQKQVTGSRLAGVLIGRGALGNPFIFSPKIKKADRGLIKKTILKHAKLALRLKGERGLVEMRKHLAAYVKGKPKAKQLRQRLVRIETIEEILESLRGA